MIFSLDLTGHAYFEGRIDALNGEPLFPDAAPEYARGWCDFHSIENPYSITEAKSPGFMPERNRMEN